MIIDIKPDEQTVLNQHHNAKETPQTTTERSPTQAHHVGPSANPALREAILAVVDQQMRDTTPPETNRTYERLVALGYAPDDARRLIGNVVAQEIFAVMQREEA